MHSGFFLLFFHLAKIWDRDREGKRVLVIFVHRDKAKQNLNFIQKKKKAEVKFHVYVINIKDPNNKCFCFLSILFFDVGDEFTSAGIQGGQEEEDDVEEHEGLDLVDGHAGLDVQLGESPFAGDDLSDEREGEAQLGQPADEELVGLGKPEQWASFFKTQRRPDPFSGGDHGAFDSRGWVVDELAAVAEGSDGSEEGEEDEEEQQRLGLVDGNPSFQVQLCQNPFPCYCFSQ